MNNSNPTVSRDFTKVPNSVLEELAKSKGISEKVRVLFVIIRKTYGWNKKSDWISLSQFEQLTGMRKPNVCRALSKLRKEGVIIKMDNNHYHLRESELSKSRPTIDKVTKENLTKEKMQNFKKNFFNNHKMPSITYEDRLLARGES